MPWPEWLKLFSIRLPEEFPVGSYADLIAFIRRTNAGSAKDTFFK
jgi:hypothetical protein